MTAQGEGWYADPQDGSRLRWWDGARWTEHTHAAGAYATPARPRLGAGWPRLALAVQASLVVTVLLSVFVVVSDRTDPAYHRRSSGWAIGAWFVPVVNLWFPFQVVSDLRDGARGEGRPPSAGLQWAWWLCFLGLELAYRATGVLFERADEVPDLDLALYADRLETAVAVETVAEVLSVVTAALAIVMVRQVTAWVRTSQPAVIATGRS